MSAPRPTPAPRTEPHELAEEHELLVRSVCAAAVSRAAGDRPVSIEWQGDHEALAVAAARRLERRAGFRFHVDVLSLTREAAARVAALARAARVDGLVSGVLAPFGRDLGEPDVHVAVDFLEHPDGDRRIDRIRSRLTPLSSLVVMDRVQSASRGPSAEAVVVLRHLFRELPPWHRFDRCSGVLIDDPALLSRDSPGGARSLIELLAERFDFEEVSGTGGLVEWLVEPPLGATFEGAGRAARAFLAHAADLEARLRAAHSLGASRFVARLVPKGAASSPADPRALLGAAGALPDLGEAAFSFPGRVEVFEHALSGESDASHLGEGFYYFEPGQGIRWSGRTFRLCIPLPLLPHPVSCEVVVRCVRSEDNPGGATVAVEGMPPFRIEAVGAALSGPDPRLAFRFSTRGGPTMISVALDHPRARPGAGDQRELGVAVRQISAAFEWR